MAAKVPFFFSFFFFHRKVWPKGGLLKGRWDVCGKFEECPTFAERFLGVGPVAVRVFALRCKGEDL